MLGRLMRSAYIIIGGGDLEGVEVRVVFWSSSDNFGYLKVNLVTDRLCLQISREEKLSSIFSRTFALAMGSPSTQCIWVL